MQAIIMAGGKGTRLLDLTKDAIPKALVKLNNKTLLDYTIEHAINDGCDNIIICTGHLGHMIQEDINNKHYDASMQISQEKESLGTGGALHLINNLLQDEFFILYADVYSTINLKKMYLFHKKRNADATIAVHESDHPQDSTVVEIDRYGKMLKLIEKPGDKWTKYGNLTQTSLYFVKKEVLSFIQQNAKQDFEKDVFPKLLKQGKNLYGYKTNEYAKDLGTPERYQKMVSKLTK